MPRFHLIVAVLTAALIAAGTALATDLAIPQRARLKDISVQKGPPNCSRWTDECVNCSRGAADEAPVCSNIGFACQPKTVRCLSSGAENDLQKK